jgi:capsular polysaccharide biosynthesis protein
MGNRIQLVFKQPINIDKESIVKDILLWRGEEILVQSKFGLATFDSSVFLYPFHQPIPPKKFFVYSDNFYIRYYKIPQTSNLKSAVLASTYYGNVNYYHFLIELIPKILFFYDVIKNYEKIIINGPVKPFVSEVFNFLKLESKLIIMNNEKSYRVKDLIILGPLSEMSIPSKLQVSLVKSRFLKNNSTSDPTLKVYISRKEAKNRRVVNENEIEEFFIRMGFMIIQAEKLSFEEQINLFKSTNVLVGFHGAGLTNMIFMNSNTKVIEMVKDSNSTNEIFRDISSHNNIDYYRLYLSGNRDIIHKGTSINIYAMIDLLSQFDFILS